jgi:hypothetical protein
MHTNICNWYILMFLCVKTLFKDYPRTSSEEQDIHKGTVFLIYAIIQDMRQNGLRDIMQFQS